MVIRLLERATQCMKVDHVVLAVPDSPEDDALVEAARRFGFSCSRGSEQDLIARHLAVADQYQSDVIVRLPGDNPVADPIEIERLITQFRMDGAVGFMTNLCDVFDSGYPDGLGAEIFRTELLREAYIRRPSRIQVEHIHRNFFDYESGTPVDEKWCPVATILCPPHLRRPHLRLDVNTYQDLQFIRRIYDALWPIDPYFNAQAIIDWVDADSA